MRKGGYIYIITNVSRTVLYTGVTSKLWKRIHQHIDKFYFDSFSAKYNLTVLLHYEFFPKIDDAIRKEKYIKGKSRKWKEKLISENNPAWQNLLSQIDPSFDL